MITLVLVFSSVCWAQSQEVTVVKAHTPNGVSLREAADTPKPVTPVVAIKMLPEDSSELAKLQQEANAVTATNKDVIAAFKQYEAQMGTLNSRASVLIARAALKAKMTIEQLDNSDLVWDEKAKIYEWRLREKKEAK